jgi:Uma2 family endonuclease
MKDEMMVASRPKRGTLAYLEAFPDEVLTLSLEEYWAAELQNAYKSVFNKNKVTAIMPYTTENHNRISRRLVTVLSEPLEQRGAELFYETRPVWIHDCEQNQYPDIFIVEESTPYVFRGQQVAETTPSVIIEILSDSNEADDRGYKLRCYKRIPTVQQIILVSQNEPLVEVHTPNLPNGTWETLEVFGLHQTVKISGIELPLSKIYQGVNF